jgi:glycosyltransferase involved in cell wall biosynthesis
MTVGSLTGLKGHIEVARAFENCNFPRTPVCLLLIGNAPRPLGFGRRFRPKLEKWVNDAKTMHQIGGPVRVAKWLLRPLLIKMRLGWLLRWLGYSATEPETLNNVLRRINAIPGRQAVVADLPRGDVIQAYLNSDLFAFASRIEYSPLVLFEAAAAGLPFVSVPVGNATEIAEWTRGGVICAAPVDGRGYTQVDPAVLASKMEWLAAQPELLEQLSAEGRRNWEERFSWNTIFRSYERILEECLQRRPV